jgi:tRNA threonylcarbamoyl adenosine modification protein (Sua5/YciO/YrdC/YwlC family)/tRNA threonylcarbamoyl adenosine modification protein YjeE
MKIIKESEVVIRDIVTVLQAGGLVIMPTETMYGAMVDATNPTAVNILTRFKNRPFGKPYSIAVTDICMAKQYAIINKTAENIYEKFLPGPVTVISKIKGFSPTSHEASLGADATLLAKGVPSEKNTIGIRIPDYKLVIDVVKELGHPITATSANASYKKRPYKISDILENVSEKQKDLIDLIIDAGELPHREPSTVIDTTLDDIATLRQGDVVLSTQCSVLSRSAEDTRNLGKELWQKYEQFAGQRAMVFALTGEMGAGKTIFTKGLAIAMGIEEEITSPTFNLENMYSVLSAQCSLSHIDAWRMENSNELKSLGFEELITDKTVIAIEWADRVADYIRKYNEEAIIIWVKIEYAANENERKISWTNL